MRRRNNTSWITAVAHKCVLATVQETVGIVDDASGKQCAHTTGTVTKWVIEIL
ncbi:hypothetical protein [Sulfuricella denitrificans]|uniref:hypothetical protein n=1 Tax=Sulfuricella denitrificans TaxID=649841 RepID=UPI0003068D78|nr:hypothetical protein [Sulfuricella denitrificans]